MSLLATIVKPIDCSVSPDGQITITQNGGSGNYDYAVTFPDLTTTMANTTGVFTGLSDVGDYTFTVTDQADLCSKVIVKRLEPAIMPIFTITDHTDVTCNGAADGTISVSATDNGIGVYTFEIISGPGSTATFPIAATSSTSNTAIFTGLEGLLAPTGITYTIRVTAANGCTEELTQVILQPAVIANVNATVVEFGCSVGNNPNNASISIDGSAITGGTNPYVIYEFINNDDPSTAAVGDPIVVQSGANSTYIETNAIGGSYTINVYDQNGCSGTTTATINPFDKLLTATAAITNPLSCNPGADGAITITVTSTYANTTDAITPDPFQYSIDNGVNYQTSNVFPNLGVGTYNFLIRHTATGCIINTTQAIAEPNTFTIDVDKLQDVICFGTETGEVTLTLVDAAYVGPFNWIIYNTNGTLTNTADDTVEKSGASPDNGATPAINLFAGSYIVEVTQSSAFPGCVNTTAFTIAGPSAALTGDTNVTPVTCALNDGRIDVIDVLGGWGGYTYFVDLASNPAPTFPGSYQTSPSFTNLAGGVTPGTDYQVWIADTTGCVTQLPNVTLVDPTPISATLDVNIANCTNLEGEIQVNGTSGGQGSGYTYQLYKNGAPFGAPKTTTIFSGLGAGSYTVQITDQWTCSFTTAAQVLYEEITVTTTVVKSIDCTITPDGEITVNVNGGSTNLEFEVTFPDGTTTQTNTDGVFTGLSQPGTYDFEVSDLETGTPVCIKTITEVLDAPSPVTFAAIQTTTDVSCNGGADGKITVVLAPSSFGINDNPIYSYTLYDAAGTTLIAGPQTDATFSGLAAGTYTIEAISSRACSNRTTAEVEEPTVLDIDAVFTAYTCAPNNTVNTSTITVSINDAGLPPAPSGTAPYLYSIDGVNYQTANTFKIVDNGTDQNITIYVKDGKSCPATTSLTIPTLNTFTATVAINDPIDCVNGREEVIINVTETVTTSGDVYSFELLPIPNANGIETASTATTATFDLTAVGNYTFRVTNTTTGCYVDTATYIIAPYDTIDVQAIATAPVVCFNGTEGTLEINVSGYSGPYAYTVYNANGTATAVTGVANTTTNPLSITGLVGGNYFVRVSETAYPSCSEDSNTVTIVSPDRPLTAIVNKIADVTCTNDKGEILIDPSGGYAPYDIQLTNTTTGQVLTENDVLSYIFYELSASTYNVIITDNSGCQITATEVLIAPLPISAGITASTTTLICFGDTDASVTATGATGGQNSFQYQLNYYDVSGSVISYTSGDQASPIFNNLGAGIYSITVSDGWDCDFETVQVEILEPTDVSASLVQVSALTCTTAATMRLTATGGTAPYQFSTDNITFNPMSGGNTHNFTVSDGIYQYYVIDNFGCKALISNQVSIDAIPTLVINIDPTAAVINCNGENTATIRTKAEGGLGNYQYELLDSPTSTTPLQGPSSSGVFANLFAGDYYVKVTSGDCEETTAVITIVEPTPLVYTDDYSAMICAGEETGYINVQLSGGSGEFQYAISPNLAQFDDINEFTNLAPGTYTVIAQDKNGCFVRTDYTITAADEIVINATPNGETCLGSSDGTINLTITGGVAPYSTSLDNTNYVADLLSYTDLASGTHTIFVIDDLGCETSIEVIIQEGVNIKATVEPIYECTGNVPDNYLLVTLDDPSVAGAALYQLDDENSADVRLEPSFTNISVGDHTLIISLNGCVEIIPFTIENFDPLILTLENNNINEITAVATGGDGNYTFYFDDFNNADDNTRYINKSGTYTVRVVDGNGCESIAMIEMEFIDIEISNFFTPNGDNENDTWKPTNLEGFPNILIIIFDRYGREVYRLRQNDKGWDGLYNDSELPTGDYWYVIKLKGENDDREFVGHFTLYR